MLVEVTKTVVKQVETICAVVYAVETESLEVAINAILLGDSEEHKVFTVDKQIFDTRETQYDTHIGGFREVKE